MSKPRPASCVGFSLVLFLGVALSCSPSSRGGEGVSSSEAAGAAWLDGGPGESWVLSDSPTTEIGVRDGEEAYQLHRAQGSTRLKDGRIVVANAGSQELRFFDSRGRYLRSVGGDGEGPGEFRFPTRVRPIGGDSLMVWDQRLLRISYLDLEGAFLGSHQVMPTRDFLFPGDEWLFGRFWIDSPLSPDAREPIRAALSAVDAPDSLATTVFVKVSAQGRIWVSPVRPPADTVVVWRVFDLDGRSAAQVETPPNFEPHEIGPDYILGRYLDSMDINYIRLYALEKPRGTRPGPGLTTSLPAVDTELKAGRSSQEGEILAPVKGLLKNLASLQEIHYSGNYTYTSDLDALFSNSRSSVPDGLVANILMAGMEGWMVTVTHPETGLYCAMAYGFYVPMGWSPGAIICP